LNTVFTYLAFLLSLTAIFSKAESNISFGRKCQISEIGDPVLHGRGRQIEMPDGRHLIVIGHHHPGRELYSFVDHLLISANDSFDRRAVSYKLWIAFKHNAVALRDFTEDVEFLKSILTSRTTTAPVTIWGEFYAEKSHHDFIYEKYPELKSSLSTLFEKLNIKDPLTYDQMSLLLAGSPEVYLHYSNPNGLPNAMMSTAEVKTDEIDRLAKERDHLDQDPPTDSDEYEKVLPFIKNVTSLYEENKFEDLKKLTSNNNLSDYMRYFLDDYTVYALRNHYISESMIHQTNDQILTIGGLHLDPIMKLLQQACLENRPESDQVRF
jgi:hypothetical protein